jgi:uncharacterized protein (TIGR03083 family)
VQVTTGIATEAQNSLAHDALQSQRQGFTTLLRGLDDDDWTAPTRCTEWTLHEVVRHLCDVTLKATALLRGALPEDIGTTNVDPRTSPDEWLARSAGEQPQETVQTFETASSELLEQVARHLSQSSNAEVAWLYGQVPWSIAVLHVFWDAWVHERDILLPMGRSHESPALESRAAAAYGFTMSCLPALVTGSGIEETVVLSGAGGGVFVLEAGSAGPHPRQLTAAGFPATGQVTITISDSEVDDTAQPLLGSLVEVVDSLVGRGQALDEVLRGPSERVRPLELFRNFLLRPVAA